MLRVSGLFGAVLLAAIAGQSHAALIVTNDTSATNLASAVTAGNTGITVTGSSLSVNTSGAAAGSGTYVDSGPGAGTYGLGGTSGIVLSSGNAADYSTGANTESGRTTAYGVAATGAQEALLDPITGGGLDHNDVVQLDITFDMAADKDTVYFDVVFGTEEFDEWIGSSFIDAFGLYVNGVNIAFVSGSPVNVDHPNMGFLSGTELDGLLGSSPSGSTDENGQPVVGSVRHTFSAFVGAGTIGNTLTFILADSGDDLLDATAYITALGAEVPPPIVPEPGSIALMVIGGLGLVGYRYRRRSSASA